MKLSQIKVGTTVTHKTEGVAKVLKVVERGVYALEIQSRPGSYYVAHASSLDGVEAD